MRLKIGISVWLALTHVSLFAENLPDGNVSHDAEEYREASPVEPSPWLVLPIIKSDPKVGTSGGGMVGYLFNLDPESTASMLALTASYSSTDSFMGGVILRSFWDQDRKRLILFAGGGEVNNDYGDFLGSGLPVQTADNLKVFQARYLQGVGGNWFAGVKGTSTNYLIFSENDRVNALLDILGLTGFDSVGVGLIALYDSRNSQNAATAGKKLSLENFAYRKSLGGEQNFDVYTLKYSHYLPHDAGKVLAYKIEGRWTSDATPSGYSSVNLRGYTRGQYLGPHSFSIEVEERVPVFGRYGVNVFAGIGCLFGGRLNCSDSENLYPSAGVGGQVMLNEKEQIALSFDLAFGKAGNNGFYVRFGQSF
jgi:hypothetical protein